MLYSYNSYGHLSVITGYKWDYTFYKWAFLPVLLTGITRAITADHPINTGAHFKSSHCKEYSHLIPRRPRWRSEICAKCVPSEGETTCHMLDMCLHDNNMCIQLYIYTHYTYIYIYIHIKAYESPPSVQKNSIVFGSIHINLHKDHNTRLLCFFFKHSLSTQYIKQVENKHNIQYNICTLIYTLLIYTATYWYIIYILHYIAIILL